MVFRSHAFQWIGGLCATLLLLAGLAFAKPAEAATLYTFAFEQKDFTILGNPSDSAGMISGTFSGTLDTFGRISLPTLTDIHIDVSGFTTFSFLNGSYVVIPTFFDYKPGDNSSFGIVAVMGSTTMPPGLLCVGLPVGVSCSGGSYRGVYLTFLAGFVATNSAMHVTLVSATPIPAGLPLFATALLGLGALGMRRRRAARRVLP